MQTHFPAWMYHRDAGSRLFQSKQELDEAGEGWAESPEAAQKLAEGKGDDFKNNLTQGESHREHEKHLNPEHFGLEKPAETPDQAKAKKHGK